MHIICLTPLEEGVYNDHKADNITTPPDGWAYIPDDTEKPSTFPRLGGINAEVRAHTKQNENGETVQFTCMTVIGMTEGTLPKPIEVKYKATADDILNAMLGVE